MAKIQPRNGKYELRGPRDTDLEGIDSKKYDVFTDDEKLANAQRDYPTYHWFASYTIKDKDGKEVRELPHDYTIRLDRPDSENFQLYYYFEGQAYSFSHQDAEDKGNKKRVKAKLKIGDPPTGYFP